MLGTAALVIPGVMPLLLFLRSPIMMASVAAAVSVYLVLEIWALAAPKPKPSGERHPSP